VEVRYLPENRVSIALLMLFLTAALFIRSFVQIRMVSIGYEPVAAKHLSALVGFVALGLFMWPVLTRVWPTVRALFRQPASWLRMSLASSALGIVVWLVQMLAMLAYSAYEWIGRGPYSQPASPEYYFNCSNPMSLFLAIPVMAVVTPIVEEIIHRGLILHSLLPRGKTLAITVSAAAFAIFHRPEAVPFAFMFGLIAAFQMLHYQTLWAVVITHAAVNLVTEIVNNCIGVTWQPGTIAQESANPALYIVLASVVCTLLIAWLAVRCKAGAAQSRSAPASFQQY